MPAAFICAPVSVSAFSTSPVSRILPDVFDTVLPVAHDVEILVGAFTRLGVVVVQAERVRLRLLQEVDDVAILVRAFLQAGALGRTLRGGGSQLRAFVSGRGFAASPVGAPGFAFRTSSGRPGA